MVWVYTPRWREALGELSFTQEQNAMTEPGLKPRILDQGPVHLC